MQIWTVRADYKTTSMFLCHFEKYHKTVPTTTKEEERQVHELHSLHLFDLSPLSQALNDCSVKAADNQAFNEKHY